MTRTIQENRHEIEKLLRSYAERTGFPVDELNRLRAERQAERRRLLTIRADAAAQVSDEEEAAFIHGVKSQRDALGLLAAPSTVITLSQPAAITLHQSNPAQTVDLDRHFEAFNSSARVHIDEDTGSDTAKVSFQFPWETQSAAVINIGTLLRLTGSVEAISDNQIFNGDPVGISLFATLEVIRGNGWGVDSNGHDLAGTPIPIFGNIFQQVGGINAEGGGFFGDSDLEETFFTALPVGLGTDFVGIPGGASVEINASLVLQYNILDGGDVDEINRIIVDFAFEPFNRRIACPFVHVEVLA